jgi:hypothetical protein
MDQEAAVQYLIRILLLLGGAIALATLATWFVALHAARESSRPIVASFGESFLKGVTSPRLDMTPCADL